MSEKILITCPYFYPDTGGLENYVLNISRGLLKENWKVIVVTSGKTNKRTKVETRAGIKIYRLPVLIKISNTPICPFALIQVKKIISYEKPDIINSHCPVPFLLSAISLWAKSIPFVLTYHSGSMKKGVIYTDFPIWLYERFFLPFVANRSTKIICSSNFVKKTMFKKHLKKCTVINPGVDTSVFRPNYHKKSNIVLFIVRHANMFKLKGLDYLIEAIKNIPYAKLHIVGEKNDNRSQRRIRYLGIRSGKKLVKEIQKSSVVVLPTTRNLESFGMVLVEAMACKTPVIGTNSCGILDVITHMKNGLIVPQKNSKAIEKAIRKILENSNLARRMGKNGLRTVIEEYLWKYKVNQTNHLFRELVDE